MKTAFAVVVPLALYGLISCGGGAEEPVAQPCVIEFAEAVLTINAVSDAATGTTLRSVRVAGLSLQGAPLELSVITRVSSNVTMSGSELICQLPCAFSILDGEYRFTLKAAGYRDTPASITARYARLTGSCPATYSGTTFASFQMAPE